MAATDRKIQRIDSASLNDVTARVAYLKSFLNFTDADGAAIQSAKDIVAPAVPAILDTVYTNLLSFDITAKAFVPRQPEQDATDIVANSVEDLYLDHPNIKHRKDFLKSYLVKLVSNSNWADDSPFWTYLDKVGVMHTGEPGFKHREKRPQLRVEYMHCGALLGFVQEIIIKAVMGADLDANTKTAVLSAFNKLLWIQNDLFARHYVVDRDSKTTPKGVVITE
ncbi:Protoglobin-domain-containing protein [Thermoascus aurantiacus ATCC 26904]